MNEISRNIQLRSFTENDIPLMAMLANNEKVSRNMRDGFPHPYTLEDAKGFIWICRQQDPVIALAIEFDDEYVGNIGVSIGNDVYRKSAEIGYFIGEPYWNKGIATMAVDLMIDYAFGKLGLARLHTGIFEYNPASMRVLEKCGFQKEGVFIKSVFKNGRLWNEHRYALINPKWKHEF